MKIKKKILSVILILCCLCANTPIMPVEAASKLTDMVFVDRPISLLKGNIYTLKLKKGMDSVDSGNYKFQSKNPSIASVNAYGDIKAKKAGTTRIIVTSKKNAKDKTTFTIEVHTKPQDIVQGGVVTTSYGIDIPVVSEFNTIGLTAVDWAGESNVAAEYDKVYGQALKAYSKAANYGIHDSPILPAGDDTIHNGTAFDDIGPVTLMRNQTKGYYYFYYTMNLNDLGKTAIAINRDLSRAMLAMITSTPAEVEAAMFDRIFGAPDSSKKIDRNGAWATIGDCEVKYTRGYMISMNSPFDQRRNPL